uniref:CUT domain-containing protein n=1 Tax=Caenorhabditis tropicalis TaxID=1561998 RepID=A0A1I7TBC3_9PELO
MTSVDGQLKEVKQEKGNGEGRKEEKEKEEKNKNEEEISTSTVIETNKKEEPLARLQGPKYLIPRDLCHYILNRSEQTEGSYQKIIKTTYRPDDKLVIVLRLWPEKHGSGPASNEQKETSFVVDSRMTVGELEDELYKLFQVNKKYLKLELYHGPHRGRLDVKKRGIFLRQVPRTVQEEFIIWVKFNASDSLNESIQSEKDQIAEKVLKACFGNAEETPSSSQNHEVDQTTDEPVNAVINSEDDDEMPFLSIEEPGEEVPFEEAPPSLQLEQSESDITASSSESFGQTNKKQQQRAYVRSSETSKVSYHDLPLGRNPNQQNNQQSVQGTSGIPPATLCRQISEYFGIPFTPSSHDPFFPIKLKRMVHFMTKDKMAFDNRMNILKCWEDKIRNFDGGVTTDHNNEPVTREELSGTYKQIKNALTAWISNRPARAEAYLRKLEESLRKGPPYTQQPIRPMPFPQGFHQNGFPNQRLPVMRNGVLPPNASIVNANGSRENANHILGRLIRVPTTPAPGMIAFQMNQHFPPQPHVQLQPKLHPQPHIQIQPQSRPQNHPEVRPQSHLQRQPQPHTQPKPHLHSQPSSSPSSSNHQSVPVPKQNQLGIILHNRIKSSDQSVSNKDFTLGPFKWQYKDSPKPTCFDADSTITAVYEYRQLCTFNGIPPTHFLQLYYLGASPPPVFGQEYDTCKYNLYYSRRRCDKRNVIINRLDEESQKKLFELNLNPNDNDPQKRKTFFEIMKIPIENEPEEESSSTETSRKITPKKWDTNLQDLVFSTPVKNETSLFTTSQKSKNSTPSSDPPKKKKRIEDIVHNLAHSKNTKDPNRRSVSVSNDRHSPTSSEASGESYSNSGDSNQETSESQKTLKK